MIIGCFLQESTGDGGKAICTLVKRILIVFDVGRQGQLLNITLGG